METENLKTYISLCDKIEKTEYDVNKIEDFYNDTLTQEERCFLSLFSPLSNRFIRNEYELSKLDYSGFNFGESIEFSICNMTLNIKRKKSISEHLNSLLYAEISLVNLHSNALVFKTEWCVSILVKNILSLEKIALDDSVDNMIIDYTEFIIESLPPATLILQSKFENGTGKRIITASFYTRNEMNKCETYTSFAYNLDDLLSRIYTFKNKITNGVKNA